MTDWMDRITRLADQLQESGDLRSPAWRTAFCAVPRHELVPRFYEPDHAGAWRLVDGVNPAQRQQWLEAVYSNTTLVTALVDISIPSEWGGGVHQVPVSSTTLPGLMIRMLEDLQIHDGQTVLEIGAGTGYNAALLCARLGDSHVASVDVRPDLVAAAEQRLAGIGYRPHLAAVDGALGYDSLAPYDRMIATCATRYVPATWIDQLKPGGMVLVDLEGSIAAGNLAGLWRPTDELVVEGRFCRQRATFMPMVHDLSVELGKHAGTGLGDGMERVTATGPNVLHQRHLVPAFLAQLHLPAGTRLSQAGESTSSRTRLVAPDGSVAEIIDRADEDGRYRVTEAGPDQLWRRVEQAVARWEALGCPTWERFGVTAGPEKQVVWFNHPNSRHRWPLDLTGEP